MSRTAPVLRPYRPTDSAWLADVCVRTGLGGEDARGHYADPEVLPAIFATPYAELEPSLVFVADDGERVIGYVLGTADSGAFFDRFRREWLPSVADRFPAPGDGDEGPDASMRELLHHADRMHIPAFDEHHPAHLHIDLLPEGQGRGLGRALMETYLDALRERGVPGVHLGVNPENTRARAFYDRLGFTALTAPGARPGAVHLGLRL
ncbi:GNAT family N-acetyltransferase [Streptomyces spiramenti]|uniref:GNAT family N-acetyltransferase n=1 Tax=Streptomyces spiramenti TaxID=2720606 RepID=A0ABX1AVD3_9ACTN|nr:GNAT family N-acetyltransferase [Streptomyces spiramenti]NJP68270.1 GNAT family N-acetyltransferase [Streptomyces spiramenti]